MAVCEPDLYESNGQRVAMTGGPMREPDSREQRLDQHVTGQGGERDRGDSDAEGVCGKCGMDAHLHEGLCRHCHQIALEERRTEASIQHEQRQVPPHQAPSIPLHSPPWRRRGA